jgi:hypothetical protein
MELLSPLYIYLDFTNSFCCLSILKDHPNLDLIIKKIYFLKINKILQSSGGLLGDSINTISYFEIKVS